VPVTRSRQLLGRRIRIAEHPATRAEAESARNSGLKLSAPLVISNVPARDSECDTGSAWEASSAGLAM
jgi:alpha-D-ribose 1-methylphosphonate 5-triphosphate diphosphatase PhnM